MNLSVKNKFAELAAAHGKYSELGDSENTNKAYEEIISVVEEIRKESDRGESMLVSLIHDENPYVACFAATYLLPIQPELGKTILNEIAGKANSLAGFDARTTLKEWGVGQLKII